MAQVDCVTQDRDPKHVYTNLIMMSTQVDSHLKLKKKARCSHLKVASVLSLQKCIAISKAQMKNIREKNRKMYVSSRQNLLHPSPFITAIYPLSNAMLIYTRVSSSDLVSAHVTEQILDLVPPAAALLAVVLAVGRQARKSREAGREAWLSSWSWAARGGRKGSGQGGDAGADRRLGEAACRQRSARLRGGEATAGFFGRDWKRWLIACWKWERGLITGEVWRVRREGS
jgi:hypothetical protein